MGNGLSVMIAAASVVLTLAAIACAPLRGAAPSDHVPPCGCRLLALQPSAYPFGQGAREATLLHSGRGTPPVGSSTAPPH